ncbi:cation efflux protein [Pholiota conissans]|uniref:Cation efflux protein n=1 Tax=Pholiota conissans TaxID=109636 RepID=A0A9P6D370_9AGAR|nr:cation efflux protein [Pholiota conissans]
MALSRSSRITLLLVIDLFFFLVELVVGYAVGSLALVADSFHMLNDVMSLVVALYAIRLTNGGSSDSRYSYGWHRAEILAALVNGVFLLALCFSISLEAIGRFFTTPDISNPKLVVIVGSLGLASNIVGLFLFHEHGHSHPPPPKPVSTTSSITTSPVSSSQVSVRGDITPKQKTGPSTRGRSHSLSQQTPHATSESFSSLLGHPAATRASLVQTAQDMASARSPSPPRRNSTTHGRLSFDSLASPLIAAYQAPTPATPAIPSPTEAVNEETPLLPDGHDEHDHGHGHVHAGHAHGSMNMRALLLHVLGDALGNVGVIATGLVIWLTTWKYKYYCDPVISLVITVIIFSSALPLVQSTSFILLQGVPSTVSLDEVRDSILDVEGVLSLHELHVWQLSENKLVASVHVLASRNHDFMPIAVKIRKALHHLGIHSCTIQPEYYHPNDSVPEEHLKTSGDTSCLILCPADENCNPSENACCRECLLRYAKKTF